MTEYQTYLKNYDGPPVRLMEVCGTHTAEISRCGIVSVLSHFPWSRAMWWSLSVICCA